MALLNKVRTLSILNLSGIKELKNLLFLVLFLLSFTERQPAAIDVCKSYINAEADSVLSLINKSIICLKNSGSVEELKNLYLEQRRHYKFIESFVEYYSPHDARYFINGPLVKKSELEYGKSIYDPRGFQVIEEFLFSGDTIDKKGLADEYVFLQVAFQRLRNRSSSLNLDASRVLDMIQFELYRIVCLNLNGYDATIAENNPEEAAWALEGCRKLNSILGSKDKRLDALYLKAIKRTKISTKHEKFDRLEFLVSYMVPLYKAVVEARVRDKIPFSSVNYALNLKEKELFSLRQFNTLYFSVNTKDTVNIHQQAYLGRLLFYDPVLSGNNKRACASCHQAEKGFTDGLPKAVSFIKDSLLSRNTPSLWNTTLQKNFFLDGRSRQAEQQVSDVFHNENEMNGSVEEVIRKLNKSDEYRDLFKKAFKHSPDTNISYYGIVKAIAEFERTLVSFNSRFDKYIRGDKTQLSVIEKNGYNLFSGKAQCATCHFLPLFTGLVPPYYNDTEYEVIGVPVAKKKVSIDPDEGRIVVSKVKIHKYAFKTTTVRNVAVTAPYMHNGVFETLDEVLEFYNNGGGKGMGIELKHQTLPFDSLKLTKYELNCIKAFMLSLTDSCNKPAKPNKLPFINDPVLNNRVIGGEY